MAALHFILSIRRNTLRTLKNLTLSSDNLSHMHFILSIMYSLEKITITFICHLTMCLSTYPCNLFRIFCSFGLFSMRYVRSLRSLSGCITYWSLSCNYRLHCRDELKWERQQQRQRPISICMYLVRYCTAFLELLLAVLSLRSPLPSSP